MRRILPPLVAIGLLVAFWRLPVWDQGVEKVSADTAPRLLAPTAAPEAMDEGGELPLPAEGLGSEAELARAVARIADEESRASFDTAFRLTFTTNRGARDYDRAKGVLARVTAKHPNLAEAYRTLAYAELNTTLSFPRTIELYERAIELDPRYGEAHYGLAFMLGQTDPTRGRKHFLRAMALGIQDERGLGERFYPEARP